MIITTSTNKIFKRKLKTTHSKHSKYIYLILVLSGNILAFCSIQKFIFEKIFFSFVKFYIILHIQFYIAYFFLK